MDSHWGTPLHRKRKRRRGADKPPISAQLVFDGRLQGDVGLLSEDLFSELFPALSSQQDVNGRRSPSDICHVAVSPHVSSSLFSIESAPWFVLAVRRPSSAAPAKNIAKSTIHFSASSQALATFVHELEKSSANISRLALHSTVEVYLVETVPLQLDTVVLSVDDAALDKLETYYRKFHQGQAPYNRRLAPDDKSPSSKKKHKLGAKQSTEAEETRRSAIKNALGRPPIIHTGDVLPLDLPSHPVTHAQPPPITIELCQPVSQGYVTEQTRVVIISTSRTKRTPLVNRTASITFTNGIVEEEEEDTSNEQFFSAAEDNDAHPSRKKKIANSDDEQVEDTTGEETEETEDSDLSESEDGDMIGLSLPSLPAQSSGVMSAFSSATPRAGQIFGNGIATPGSIVSTFSTGTVLGGMSRGRLFAAHGLATRIPDDALLPKPLEKEDDESRIFVDTTSLAKLGCFSGDWVRIEAAPESGLSALASLGIGSLTSKENEQNEWRVAKVYSLPGQSHKRQRYAIDKSGHNRFGGSLAQLDKSSLKVYLSPLLLANLGSPPNIRIASIAPPPGRAAQRGLLAKNRITGTSLPPIAREVSLFKFSSTISMEKSEDNNCFSALKKHFEQRARIVKSGDLIAIPVDDKLGRAFYSNSSNKEDDDQDEFTTRISKIHDQKSLPGKINIAWFKVGPIMLSSQADAEPDDDSPWGELAAIKQDLTTLRTVGSEQGKMPETMSNTWPYYLGVKRLPSSGNNSQDRLPEPPKTYISQIRRRLRELILAATSPQAVHLSLPPLAILITSTQRHIGKHITAANACADLGLHAFSIDAYDITSEGGPTGGDQTHEKFLKTNAERAMLSGAQYTALIIRHIEVLSADYASDALREILTKCRIIIATTTDLDKVPDNVRSQFTHELEMNAPDEGEREGILRDLVQASGLPLSSTVDLSSVALKTAALVAGDLVDVVGRADIARRERLEKMADTASAQLPKDSPRITVQDIQVAGGDTSRSVVKADFDQAVEAARKNFADAIGAPKIPNVSWDDVGGLSNVKDAVMETIQLPLERPELFAKGMKKRSGILFYGPPGTGKTLLAKAIATEFSLNFFSVKGPELLNMYIGESEANVRRVFQRARDARPCVVFFDELDSVAPKRGNQGDSGGVMDRIVSQLLAELDGMSNGEDGGGGVFVIGATNRPDLLDQALLRPGRFDKMLYLGVSDTHDKQQTILEALTRKFTLHPSLSLATVAATLPFTFTGADLYALCSDAMLKAITRRASAVDAKVRTMNAQRTLNNHANITTAYFFDHLAEAEDTTVVVEAEDFAAAGRELVPSVSAKELEHYRRVRQTFEQGDTDGSSKNNRNDVQHQQQPLSQQLPALPLRRVNRIDLGDAQKRQRTPSFKGKEHLRSPTLSSLSSSISIDDTADEDYALRRPRTKSPTPSHVSSLSLGTLSIDDGSGDGDGDALENHGVTAVNGGTSTFGASKGKGKGKAKVVNSLDAFGFGSGVDGDDDTLYG